MLFSFPPMKAELGCYWDCLEFYLHLSWSFLPEYQWQFNLVMLLWERALNCLHCHSSSSDWTPSISLLPIFLCPPLPPALVSLLLQPKTTSHLFQMPTQVQREPQSLADTVSTNLSNETTDDFLSSRRSWCPIADDGPCAAALSANLTGWDCLWNAMVVPPCRFYVLLFRWQSSM